MKMPSVLSESLIHNALRAFLAKHSETIWTGYGASYAMAATIALAAQRLGYNARAKHPSEIIGGQNVAVVSRSYDFPGRVFGFVIAGCAAESRIKSGALLVKDDDIGGEWFPAVFQKRALTAIGKALDIQHTEVHAGDMSQKSTWFVCDDCADQIQLLAATAHHKLPALQFFAVSVDDFAHGPHARILREGGVCLVKTKPSGKIDSIAEWLRERHCPVNVIDMPFPSTVLPLAIHSAALSAITVHAKMRGVDLSQIRVNPADDELRHAFGKGGMYL